MYKILLIIIISTLYSCIQKNKDSVDSYSSETKSWKLQYPEEKHLKNIKQLTFGGDNAEAYFSFDDSKLVFQSNYAEWNLECDQIFITDINNSNMKEEIPDKISTGLGRTTCAYFKPGDTTIIYASTHLIDAKCPHVPERTDGEYVWPIYE